MAALPYQLRIHPRWISAEKSLVANVWPGEDSQEGELPREWGQRAEDVIVIQISEGQGDDRKGMRRTQQRRSADSRGPDQ